MAWRRVRPLADRLAEKVSPEPNSGCWLWLGNVLANGYAVLSVGRRSLGERRTLYAHRLMYEMHRGPIPAGLDLDHLCRVRCCVNPDHLEAVTRRVNTVRGIGPAMLGLLNGSKTHCKHGHEFTPDNTYKRPTGGRACRACAREIGGRTRGDMAMITKYSPEEIRQVAD